MYNNKIRGGEMNTLIVYATKYGCTEKAVNRLADYLGEGTELLNLGSRDNKAFKLEESDTVVVGGSIYAGNIQQEVKEFCSENINTLLQKKLGLFICCGMSEKAREQLENSFDKKLLEHALTTGYFGYEFNFDRMNFISRFMVKKLAKVKENKSEIKEENIKEFAEKLQRGEIR